MNYYATWFWSLYARAYDQLLELHPYREYLRDIQRLVDRSAELSLELGAGTGNIWSDIFSSKSPPQGKVVLLDASPVMLGRARHKLRPYKNVTVMYGDMAERLPFQESSVDQVVLANALYTCAQPQAMLQDVHRILKSGGRLIVCDPAPTFHIREIFQAHLGRPNTESLPSDNSFATNFTFLLQGAFQDSVLRRNLVPLTFVLWINTKLLQRQSRFFSHEELATVLTRANFYIEQSRPTYAGQNNLFLARKAS